MSKPVSRSWPFSVGAFPMVMPRRKRSHVSKTRFLQRALIHASSVGEEHLPRERRRVDVEAGKATDLVVRELGRVGLGDPKLAKAAQHHGGKDAGPVLLGRAETVEERLGHAVVVRIRERCDGEQPCPSASTRGTYARQWLPTTTVGISLQRAYMALRTRLLAAVIA